MNVIWIVCDTFRRDHLGAYGNKEIITPVLDDLASKSMRFNKHYMASFPTMPARADFLTGLATMSFMKWEALPYNVPTLPEILSKNGVTTAAVVDTPFYRRGDMNYDRGFEHFIEVQGQWPYSGRIDKVFKRGGDDYRSQWRHESDTFAAQTFTKATEWLERNYKENFFLYIDTWDPHEPWDAPEYYTELYMKDYDGEVTRTPYGNWHDAPGYTEEKLQKARATYCGECTMVDTWIGHFMNSIKNMNLMDNTAIIFTTDHGYYIGEHGGLIGKLNFAKDPKTGERIDAWDHSFFYEEVSGIPLYIYMPGAKPGVCDNMTSAIDLMPTVMDLLGQKIDTKVDGKSLVPMIKDPSAKVRDFTISAPPFSNPGDTIQFVDNNARPAAVATSVTVTEGDWALIYDPTPGMSQLYNLKDDPEQSNNVIANNLDKAKDLHQKMLGFMRETGAAQNLIDARLKLEI